MHRHHDMIQKGADATKRILTLVWQDEPPDFATLRQDLRNYAGKTGVVLWDHERKCWLIRIHVVELTLKQRIALMFGFAPVGKGEDWFEIVVTPNETFLSISTCGRHQTIEQFAKALAQYFVLARHAALIED